MCFNDAASLRPRLLVALPFFAPGAPGASRLALVGKAGGARPQTQIRCAKREA